MSRGNYSSLPSVSFLLEQEATITLVSRFGRPAVTEAVREVLAKQRALMKADSGYPCNAHTLLETVSAALMQREKSSLQPVFNLTGTVLHTNLGRALLAECAIEAVIATMRENVTLEYDLDSGARGERDDHVRNLICELTGAEDATVVNNNAAAVLLCLNSLALGRSAVVSRGELIEIGGSFRMPDIMARAGVRMVEVGTTNRTHLADYRQAIDDDTRLILKVHTSNYRIQGFTAEVDAQTLAELAAESRIPLFHDLGSGTLVNLADYGMQREPTVREAIAHGVPVVSFSGDKLLGGPQVGVIVGARAYIEMIRRNPLRRALRVDKIRLAALEATLKLYRDPGRLAEHLPALKLLSRPRADIENQAKQLAPLLSRVVGANFTVVVCDCSSEIGSGALPLDTLPSAGLAIRPVARGGRRVEQLASALRRLRKPIIARIEDGALIMDLRCLTDVKGFMTVLGELNIEEAGPSAPA